MFKGDKAARRREVAHSACDDGRVEDHLLLRRPEYLEAEDATFPERA